MKISVAMCTYNGELYIRQQLESIFAQTRLPDEIILCDDVSRDNTVAIAEEFQDKGIALNIHRNTDNLGFVKNFRQCISMCTGDIIFLCDQDDIWEPNKTEQLCNLMEARPEILSLCTNYRYIDSDGAWISVSETGDNKFYNKFKWDYYKAEGNLYNVSLNRLLSSNISPGATQVVRRSILEEYFRENTMDPHDWVLNRVAALHRGAFYYDVPLTRYRLHANQTIGVPDFLIAKERRDFATIFENYFNIFRVFIYQAILKKYDKVGELPRFGYSSMIAHYDTLEYDEDLRDEYLHWREMAWNRTLLYRTGPGRFKYFIKQGKYNKYMMNNYGKIERLQWRVWDLTALILK